MSSSIQTGSKTFANTASERLSHYLAGRGEARADETVPLTPDASTREYFRIPWQRGHAVAAVYPEPFDEEVQPYIDITGLFLECALPVPEIYSVDGKEGIIVQEDLGDRQLWQVLDAASDEEREALVEEA